MSDKYPDLYEVPPFSYTGSAIGNALYSGLSLKDVFECACVARNEEEFDTAVSATILLAETMRGTRS